MKKILVFGIINYSLCAAYSYGMDNYPLTIQTADGEMRKFDAQELSDRHKDLCTLNAERLLVVNSKTLKLDDEGLFIIALSDTDKAQLIKALLSSNAQDPASLEGCYVVDVANLQPLPQAIHDIVYEKTAAQLPHAANTVDSSNDSGNNSEEEFYKHTKQDVPTILSDIHLTQQEYAARVLAICNVPASGITLCDSNKGDTGEIMPITSEEQQLLKEYLLSSVEAVVQKDLNEPKRILIDLALLKQLPAFSAVVKDSAKDARCTQKPTLLQIVFSKTTLSCAACIVGTYLITTRLHSSNN